MSRTRRSGIWRNLAALVAGLALAGGACRDGPDDAEGDAAPAPTLKRHQPVYVAVGASESVGVGADRPLEQAWPQVLHRSALPPGSRFVNLGIPGATVADALRLELPEALAQHPTLATVWLNVNDLLRGVRPDDYEHQLGELVHALRRGGATRVLVANTPAPGLLPVYAACPPAPPAAATGCPPGRGLPWQREVDAVIDAYNAAIARVVWREGAVLVDLHAGALAAQKAGISASLISGDGFHPSTAGHRAVAELFAEALRASGGIDG
ncbi:MAG: GDSL-type esterase/lipase family protein [Actinomycetota bacterium]|nr:GDSL-type esterase/lipase family protein [Actinomycetota bacterium]